MPLDPPSRHATCSLFAYWNPPPFQSSTSFGVIEMGMFKLMGLQNSVTRVYYSKSVQLPMVSIWSIWIG